MSDSLSPLTTRDNAEAVQRVTLLLCSDCLDGKGGECHTPGCALWMNRAPDLPIRGNVEATCPGDDGPLDEMGNLSIALPPEAWRHLFVPIDSYRAPTLAAIQGALTKAGEWR